MSKLPGVSGTLLGADKPTGGNTMPLPTDVNATQDINTSLYCTLQTMGTSDLDNMIVGVGLLLFFIGMLVFRYRAIISPSMMRLESELQSLRAQALAYPDTPAQSKLVAEQKRILEMIEQKVVGVNALDKCFISSGRIISGWRMLHNAKNIIIDEIGDINEELEVTRLRLAELDSAEAKNLAKRIELNLKKEEATEKSRKQLLVEGRRVYYSYRDDYFEMLADWQNKTMWLTYITLLFIAMLLWVEQNALLLVAGGIGGLLSKLRSVIQKPDIPNDYGFSWSTLFLTPMIGVLTGWAGLYLVIVLIEVDIFGPLFTEILSGSQGCPSAALMIIALVFGYSAGLFEKMITKVETYATKEKKKIDVTAASEGNEG
ncbi:hypothetical protein LOH54_07670 [Sulfurimonas sp. HSL-3221]|uniref:hypothetical protein n=1 Tax=Thiomicrolovo sulfuroxydans TaxID=2894755 RepID=UPI001E573B47|nr:hypothetical protein [Sulfurimonas sp. HSL-3221]UFS61539.1 hypothetical protein LOH54_07670 [Sulfurimonas sp. HSL-3221]